MPGKGNNKKRSDCCWDKEVMRAVNVGMTNVQKKKDFEVEEWCTARFPHDEAMMRKISSRNCRSSLCQFFWHKIDPSVMSKVVCVTDQGSNVVAALWPYRCLDCQDHIYNTVLQHALDITELSVTHKVVQFEKQSSLASQLSKTVLQMGETRYSTVFLTLKFI